MIFVRVSLGLSFDDEESFEAVGSLRFNNPPLASDPDSPALERVGSSSSMLPQERNDEDICFNHNPPSDPNEVGSTSSMPSQERIEIT